MQTRAWGCNEGFENLKLLCYLVPLCHGIRLGFVERL